MITKLVLLQGKNKIKELKFLGYFLDLGLKFLKFLHEKLNLMPPSSGRNYKFEYGVRRKENTNL